MKVTLLAVVALTTVAIALVGAADPECVYRRLRGLTPHWPKPSTCSSYYRCTKGSVRTVKCPAGKEYNAKTGKCGSAGRGLCKLSLIAPFIDVANPCANEVNGAYVPKSGYCSDFYICDEQTAYPQSCDSGSFFNQTSSVCELDKNSECWQNDCVNQADGVYIKNKEYCASYYICLDQVPTPQDCNLGSYFNATFSVCTVDEDNTHCWENFCINETDGTLLADSANCSNYYVCSNETATIDTCDEGYYFDVYKQSCVEGSCSDTTTTSTTTESCDDSTTSTTEACDVETTTPASSNCDCSNNGETVKDGELSEDVDNCRLYKICVNGELNTGDCLKGNYFDSKLKACVKDSDNVCPESCAADCTENDVTLKVENCAQYNVCKNGVWQTVNCSVGYYFNSTLGICAIDEDGICPNSVECNDADPTASGATCWKYYACINGKWQQEACLTDYYFDESMGICRADDDSVCPENRAVRDNTRSKRSVDQEDGQVCVEGTMVSHSTDCDKYLICQNQQWIPGTCGVGNLFKNCSGICAPDTTGSCWLCGRLPNGYTIPDPSDCKSYITCYNGLANEKSCPSGEWFNGDACVIDVTGVCINPCSGCDSGTKPHPICSKYYQCSKTGAPQVVDCDGQGYDATTGQCSPDVECSALKCATADTGATYPVEDDDTKFYACIDGETTIRSCPSNQLYVPAVSACLLQPSCKCNQTVCIGADENKPYPSLGNDNTTFCICQFEEGFLESCLEGYEFNEVISACEFTGPCDPSVCTDETEYKVTTDYNDPDSFCLCRAGEQISVPCPIGYTFSSDENKCVLIPQPDPRCCRNYCVGKEENLPFPALNGDDTGFCYCVDELPKYEKCLYDYIYDNNVGACLAPQVECDESNNCDHSECLVNDDPGYTFPSKNGCLSGFCYCKDECAIWHCQSSEAIKLNKLNACDSAICKLNDLLTKFSARNTTDGYCLCNANGLANYYSCEDEHHFDSELNSCVIIACDSALCRQRSQFATFAAKNTTSGFCSCDGLATYHHCSPGHIFDINEGACVLQTAISALVCNSDECKSRVQYQPFAALNTSAGFCSCDGNVDNGGVAIATYHACTNGHSFKSELGMCFESNNSREKRSLETEEKLSCEIDEKRSVPSNCSQYEICIEGDNWRRRTCSDYRYYNPEQQRCLEPRDDMVCKYARITHLPACNNQTEAQTMPARGNNCLQYFRCAGDKWRLRNCPKQQYFARKVGTCLPIPKDLNMESDLCPSILNSSIVDAVNCQHLSVRPASVGCGSYLMCLDNAWWQQQCPLNMYFSLQHNYCLPNNDSDESEQHCKHEENSTCSIGQRRSSLDSCRSYEECNLDGKWIRQTCSQGEQFEAMFGCVPTDNYTCQANGLRRVCQTGELRALPVADVSEAANCLQYFQYCENENWLIGNCLRGQSFVHSEQRCLPRDECQSQAVKVKFLSTSCQNQTDGQSVADVEDCTRFYLCLQQEAAILQRCASGSFFDANLGYCRPNDGSCQLPLCEGLDDGSLVPHPVDCQAYYSCSQENGTQLIYCSEGEYYHSILAQCRADHGQCRNQEQVDDDSDDRTSLNPCTGLHGIRLQHEIYCNLYYACVKGLAIPVECPNQQQFNPVLGHCENEDESWQKCENGQLNGNNTYSCGSLADGSYLANRTDCTRYFICAGGVALAQRCGTGFYFDAEQLLCVADDGSCPYVDTEDDSDEGNNQHVPPDPLVCEGKHGLIMPDPANCNNFYICVSSKLRHECCYTGYFFNATLLQCQAYDVVEEDDTAANENATESVIESQSLKPFAAQQVSQQCTDLPTNFTNICQIIGDGASVAEQGDCRRYTSCEANEATSQRCRNGESFDSFLGICRQNDGTCLMENGERTGVCNGKHGQFAQNTDNCAGYFVCVHGQKIEEECEQGDYFNRLTNTCEKDVLQQCSNANAEDPLKIVN
ncbi:LOW QUALITY PROTEIN: fibrillin-1 [Drosophila tropicalis]|uniref:LOW QUALITY PROTEIN: fibrillin-1 n=1 Tax=Drosophila tropicalis TaxID=46794 RepID=UPI0035AB9513